MERTSGRVIGGCYVSAGGLGGVWIHGILDVLTWPGGGREDGLATADPPENA